MIRFADLQRQVFNATFDDPRAPFFRCAHYLFVMSPSLRLEMNRLSAPVGILALLLLCAPAMAAGFLVRENSAEAVGLSYAGNGSRADAPDTVFSNPAGMTRLERPELEFGSAVILPSSTFSGVARQGGVPIAGNTGGQAGRAALIA